MPEPSSTRAFLVDLVKWDIEVPCSMDLTKNLNFVANLACLLMKGISACGTAHWW
jgi:hypothetical protein